MTPSCSSCYNSDLVRSSKIMRTPTVRHVNNITLSLMRRVYDIRFGNAQYRFNERQRKIRFTMTKNRLERHMTLFPYKSEIVKVTNLSHRGTPYIIYPILKHNITEYSFAFINRLSFILDIYYASKHQSNDIAISVRGSDLQSVNTIMR